MPTEQFLRDLKSHAASSADRAALRWRGRSYSYGWLDRRAASYAEQLAELPSGRPVLLAVDKSADSVALTVAAHSVGCPVLVPATTLGAEAIARLAEGIGAAAQLTLTEDGGLVLRRLPHRARSWPASAALTWYTTSGSTGRPKVVVPAAVGVDRFLDWAAAEFEIDRMSRVLSFAPLNFDLSLLDIWTTLSSGGCVVLVDPDRSTDPGYLHELLATERPTVVQAVPMFFRLLELRPSTSGAEDVRQLISTGEALTRELAESIRSRFRRASLVNVYGCTETNDSFALRVPPDGPLPVGSAMPIGTPVTGVAAELRDAADRPITGAGRGELLVASPFTATGYLDERENARFEVGPDGQRWYRTGDLVERTADGSYRLVGRTDFQVKVRGVRINLQEIEHVLDQHPDVLEAVVLTQRDELAGLRLTCQVRRRAGSSLTGLGLRAYCGSRLDRAAIPSTVSIVEHPLPRTGNGKIDRTQVDAALAQPVRPGA